MAHITVGLTSAAQVIEAAAITKNIDHSEKRKLFMPEILTGRE
ncbi:MAG TPA: hypothetical protein VGN42_19470 [Pirellulales bacterium]|nr:hypothetical protein [Pirellulales bacterium]